MVNKCNELSPKTIEYIQEMAKKGYKAYRIIRLLREHYAEDLQRINGLTVPTLAAYIKNYLATINESSNAIKNIVGKDLVISSDKSISKTLPSISELLEDSKNVQVDKLQILNKLILIALNRIQLIEQISSFSKEDLIPRYLGEIRQVIELLCKLSGEIEDTNIVVNIVNSEVEGIMKAIKQTCIEIIPDKMIDFAKSLKKNLNFYKNKLQEQTNLEVKVD